MSKDKRDARRYGDPFAGASEEPDEFWPNEQPNELVTEFSQARVDELGYAIVEIILTTAGGLRKTAFLYAEDARMKGMPADEVIYAILHGAFADFVVPWTHDPPATKSQLLRIWVNRYVALTKEGVSEPVARGKLIAALKQAHLKDPGVDSHFAGIPPYLGENGKPPGRSTVNRWTKKYRAPDQ